MVELDVVVADALAVRGPGKRAIDPEARDRDSRRDGVSTNDGLRRRRENPHLRAAVEGHRLRRRGDGQRNGRKSNQGRRHRGGETGSLPAQVDPPLRVTAGTGRRSRLTGEVQALASEWMQPARVRQRTICTFGRKAATANQNGSLNVVGLPCSKT